MAEQDFSTFTENDINNKYTVTPNKIEVLGLVRGVDFAIVYDDYGFAKIDGDFMHNITTQSGTVVVSATSPIVGFWCLANDIDDLFGLLNTGKSILSAYITKTLTEDNIVLREQDGATGYADSSLVTYGDKYFHTIKRNESVGTFGTLFCYIFEDSARNILFDVLSIALHGSKKDFSIIYGALSWDDGGDPSSISADIENLIFVEEAITVGEATAELDVNNNILVTMPYTNDDNNDSTYTVDYKKSSSSVWINSITNAPNTPSPFTHVIEGLQGGMTYDVRVTYVDPDGVIGENPQIISNILVKFVLGLRIYQHVLPNSKAFKI